MSYIHRIGRTGREGRSGQAVTFFTEQDRTILRNIAQVRDGSLLNSMICFKDSDKRDALFASFKSFQILF